MCEIRGFIYECDCVKPMIESIIEKLLPLEEITEAYLDPVSLSGITGTILEYKAADKKKSKRLIVTHTFCPFCGKKLLQESERFTVHSDIERQDDKWIPVSERLPKDCELVWVRATNSPHNLPRRAFYTYRNGKWVNDEVDIDNVYSNLYVTHWMPLPVLSEVQE